MKIVQFVKPVLFIYELIRIMVLVFVLILFGNESTFLIKIVYTAPCALLPLMALFIWLDSSRYREYIPLLLAGKFIGIFILAIWSIISKQVTMIEGFILSGDLFAIAAVLLINKDIKETTEPQITADVSGSSVVSEPETEEK